MPLYEYQCDACGRRFEIIQKLSDGPPDACRLCGKGPVHRLISSPAFQFKGTGWYATDYAQKGKSENATTSDATKAAASSDSAKTDAASSDTSSAPKSDSAPASAPASNTTADSPKK